MEFFITCIFSNFCNFNNKVRALDYSICYLVPDEKQISHNNDMFFSKADKILVKSWHELKASSAKGLVLKVCPKKG